MNEIHVSIQKIEGGYIVDSAKGRKIFTSQSKAFAELKRLINEESTAED